MEKRDAVIVVHIPPHNSPSWEEVVFGKERRIGVGPLALWLAARTHAPILFAVEATHEHTYSIRCLLAESLPAFTKFPEFSDYGEEITPLYTPMIDHATICFVDDLYGALIRGMSFGVWREAKKIMHVVGSIHLNDYMKAMQNILSERTDFQDKEMEVIVAPPLQ